MNIKRTKILGKIRILVDGARGFIGTHLIQELKKDKNNVVIEYLKDVCENFTLKKDYDIIYHLAANTDTTFHNDIEMYRNNILSFLMVLDFAIKCKAKLIYASSAAVYGKRGRDEKPLNAYGDSKKVCDDIAKKFFNIIPIIGLRLYNVYGMGEEQKGKMASMITQWRKQVKRHNAPKIFDGTFKRDFVYIKDVTQAFIKAQKLKSGIYDVGTGKAVDFRIVLDIIMEELGSKRKPIFIPNPYLGKYQTYTKANLDWGFKPDYNIKTGIKDYFENYDK